MKASSDELKVFIAVVESGSFSRAAEQLQMANSAVSRTVKKLENKLGVALLTRTTRQLALTHEGEHYFRRVQKLMQEMSTAESELIERQLAPQGVLRIDAATPVILHLLLPMIKPFRERYPDVTLSLISSESFINLIERKVDVAIRAGNLTDSTLRARLLFISYRKLVATPAYLAKYGVPASAADLVQHECLGFVETPRLNRWPVAGEGGELYDITPGMSSNSGETLKQLVLGDQGIACLSDFMVDKEIADGTFIELLAEHRVPVEMPFNAVYYSDLGVSQRVRAFIDFLSEWVKDQPWRVQG
ncbi:DNA-binding transcriptional regulator, LysR family [Candidatus Pantoea symbiotica]|jgi:DNA-binding transcriptional LysR family regulator|uniref:DNA-binding transcriptional regulator, LysR family n=1 Tax=Candidatus Pantoea symbiotica TaxID=1884370 RepID=A0A1I4E4E2_9GAMM|nr:MULTISPECIES: DNA-binding transcriptional regulator YafC [Pantoea]KAJ9434134.1 DNA-binding transcriptional regulator YafC [Pantoea sp. YR343]MRT27038.1 LysR family transcriptional regulator [Enterobacteriaceae bacterium RIT697]SFK99031.1 DNA-binding transcriptional regulator, LysR family [Pantoea symbiotica]SFV06966.1 DNA-binding transcriptional regulator, LysR family [Pantoea sp. YR525]